MLAKFKAILAGAKCSCLTKTPEARHHKEDCTYRVFVEGEKKGKWVKEANDYLTSLTGAWDKPEYSIDYCESLYQSYVEDMGGDPFSPQDAVDEDMTYWD